jgi:hypothetical protein
VKDHAQLSTIRCHGSDQFQLVVHAWHLSDAKRVILLEDLAEILKVLMQSRTTGIMFGAGKNRAIGVWVCLIFANEIDHIESEPVDAAIQPEAHDVVDSCADLRIFPVEVGLFLAEEVEVIFISNLIVFPRAAFEMSAILLSERRSLL